MSRKLLAMMAVLTVMGLPLGASTFVVSNNNPSGPGSLAQAIIDSDGTAGPNTISFSIGSGQVTISPTAQLPVITNQVTIDGSTQPGFSGTPIVVISGVNAGASADGLVISANNCVIKDLAIVGFNADNDYYYEGNAIDITNGGSNVIEGCYLGIEPDGFTPGPNSGAGVLIGDPNYYDYYFTGPLTTNNIIGSSEPGEGNVISANYFGVYVIDSTGNWIHGNFIGTDATGSFEEGNTNSGVTIYDYYSTNNLVGGTNEGDMNLISGNGPTYYYDGEGVYIYGSSTNAVYGNFIGTDITGTYGIQNGGNGVEISYGYNNLIGGSGDGQGNLISGNGANGVLIAAPEEDDILLPYGGTPPLLPFGNIIQGNAIGTDITGANSIGNQEDGVLIQAIPGNLVGGYLPYEGNIINFNTNDGVEINDYQEPYSNSVVGNIIWSNGYTGVGIGYYGRSCPIISNFIYANGYFGIDLNEDGVTPNHLGGPVAGANYDQNYPVLGFPLSAGSQTTLSGTLNSAPNGIYFLQFFENSSPDPSGYGQGQFLIANVQVQTDNSGNASFNFNLPEALPYTDWITATATDTNYDTSEFSLARQVVSPDSDDLAVTLGGGASPAPKSQPYQYSITVTNNGPATATDVVVSDPLPAGLSFISAVSSQGSCAFNSGTLTCNVGTLAETNGAAIVLTVQATATETVTNTISATSDEMDNNPANDTASLISSFGLADMAIGGSVSPNPVVAGQSVTYDLIATNLGPDSASDAILDFELDSSQFVTSASVSQGSLSLSGNDMAASFGSIPAGGTATLTVTAITSQVGSFDEYGSIGALESDTNTGNNNLDLDLTANPGPGVVAFSSPSYGVEENVGLAIISVVRTGGAIGPITVNFATANGTAIAGQDYVATNGTLDFADGQSNAVFSVQIINSDASQCNKTLGLQLSQPTGGVVLAGVTSASLIIFNTHPVAAGMVQGVSLADQALITTADGYSTYPSISDNGRYIAFYSDASDLVTTPNPDFYDEVYLRDRMLGTNFMVSISSNGAPADNYSEVPLISADGQEIVFLSSADNLAAGTESENEQVFARNMATGSNVLVSVNTNGIGGNSQCSQFSISTNSRQIAFTSYSTDLVTNNLVSSANLYYRNLTAGPIQLVNLDPEGYSGEGSPYNPTISGNGRYVIFSSYSGDLATNGNFYMNVYERDMQQLTPVTVISVNPSGQAGKNSSGEDIAISADGRYVAFDSYASDLTAGLDGTEEIFLRDTVANTTTLLSVNATNGVANDYCRLLGMSRNGRYVLYWSYADNLAPNTTDNQPNLYVCDTVSNVNILITIDQAGTGPGSGGFDEASIDPSGRYVIFTSQSTNLVTNTVPAQTDEIYVRDLLLGTTTLESTAYGTTEGGNGGGYVLAISTNGVAAFDSYANDLAEADDNGNDDVFARTPGDANVELISQGFSITGDEASIDELITRDGAKVAFTSYAGDLIPDENDTNQSSEIFLYDLATHAIELISANPENNGVQFGNCDTQRPSYDGHYVAYHNQTIFEPEVAGSRANNRPDIIFNPADQIYLRDSVANVTTLISSVSSNSTVPGDGNSTSENITSNGLNVVFQSTSDNLVTNNTGGNSEIFLRNRTNAACQLISVGPGNEPANNYCEYATISDSARYVAYDTLANNLGSPNTPGQYNVYLRDLLTGSNILCSPNYSGTDSGNGDSFNAVLSADGANVIFFSSATDLIPDDTNSQGNLFAFNIASRTVQIVGINTNGQPGNGTSSSQSVTPDGRYVAFYATSTDLAPGLPNQEGNVFVRDLVVGTTELISVNCSGTSAGNNLSLSPAISADGRYVTYISYATDLTPGVFLLDSGSIFLRDRQGGSTILASLNLPMLGEGNGYSYNPTISDSGAAIAFLSVASDLIAGDANGTSDVFAWTTGAGTIDLAMTKTASASSVAQGSPVSYTLTVTNFGLTNATGVTVTDPLPAALTYVSATASQGTFSYSGGIFTANVGSLAIGAGASITLNATAAAGTVINTAVASASQPEFFPGNNTASATVLVTGPVGPALSISVTNSHQIFISWPYPSTGFDLQTTTQLAPPARWAPVTNSVANNGLLNYVLLNINTNEVARFYRLLNP